MAPLVSINLCCFNSEKFLEQTLQSVFDQTFTDWELVVVNDGSTDSTDSIIRQHIAAGRRIIYHPQKNAGLGASRNRAIELSSGKYIALIDHDDLWMADKLARLVPLFDRAEVALVYSNADLVNADGATIGVYRNPDEMHRGRVLRELFLGDFAACSSVVIRRCVLDKVGFFPPELHIVEEYDLFLRIAARYEFDYVPSSLLKLRLHESNSSWNAVAGRKELTAVLRRAIACSPEIVECVGRAAVSLRMAGFSCTLPQARLLGEPLAALRTTYHGRPWRALCDLPKPLCAFALSLFPFSISDALVALSVRLRRSRAAV